MSKHVAYYECIECKKELSYGQVMHNHGVCPLCGKVSDSTICDHEKKSRKVDEKPRAKRWWLFWLL
jgi:transcription initiation factor IIE alpha subunit